MNLHIIDISIIAAYLVLVALVGFVVQKRASRQLDSYFLADRKVPWWMLGLSGCSSYIDIGGTMAMVGAMFYLGLKSIWMTHIFWGWFMICFYMAFQAKYIRRSGVMTFAEWNKTRFGDDRFAEYARIAAAIFLLILMIANLMYIAVGTGKFAEEFLPFARWQSALIVFAVVGIYVTLGGFFGVILTDVIQTVFIAVGALILAVMAFQNPEGAGFVNTKAAEWSSLGLNWTLWDGYLQNTPASYQHFYFFGTIMMAGFIWVIFRILAGPNVWDFQFFLTTRSPREAQLAAGTWTVGYTLRWIIGCAFMILGIYYLGSQASFDAEKIMPLVLKKLPIGMQGIFMAVLLAALMSTLSAMINVTSSVITNDFLKRYFVKNLSQKALVNWARIASVGAITLGFIFSLSFDTVISAWETMIFVVVTMILVPATFRWHWWRFSAKAFVWGMILSTLIITLQKIFFNEWLGTTALMVDVIGSFIVTFACGFYFKPTNIDVLVSFYSRVRPFGFWKPVREESERRGLIPVNDIMPKIDILNGFITAVFQMNLAILPFYIFLRQWTSVYIWSTVLIGLSILLYFTWYKNLPAKDEV